MKLLKFRDKGCMTLDEASTILRSFGYADDIADDLAYQEIVRSRWPNILSDFIIDGPLSDSTVEDFLV